MLQGGQAPELRRLGCRALEEQGCPHAVIGWQLMKYVEEDHWDRHSYTVTCPFCHRTSFVWESML